MKVVFEVVSAQTAPVAVIDGKIGTLGPLFCCLLARGFRHVENYRNSVLVVVSLDSLVSVRCVTRDKTVGFGRKLGLLKILQGV